MRKIVNTLQISREEWLTLRKGSIGGSDAGAVMGMNPYRSALEVYADKKGMIPDKEQNEAMRLGSDLEDYVAKRFEEMTGKKVRRDNYMYAHDDYPFMTANVDRVIVGENAGLECKTMSPFSKYDVAAGEIPDQYYAQCQHYMAVMAYDRMYIAILVYQKGVWQHPVERNDEFIKQMIQQEKEFWENHVIPCIPPEPDGSESAIDTLVAMYPDGSDDTEVYLPDNDIIQKYQECGEAIKRLKSQQDDMKASICAVLADCNTGRSDQFVVTWKKQDRTTINSKKLLDNYPEIYNELKSTTSTRVMRVKKIKKETRK